MTAPDATSLPATLPAQETADALASSAVWRWWQTTSFLEVAGPEAASFLDGLCTQAVERIDLRHSVPGLFLDAKAKIIAPAIVHRLDDEEPRILLETTPELIEPLRAHLAKYRLRAKVTIEPSELATVALVGATAPTEPPGPTNGDGSWSVVREQARPTVAFIGPAHACAALVRPTSTEGGFPLADPDALEADRIERGIAGLHDLLPGRMPAEVGGMDAAVALDAGCYLGQEPVARLHYRGHANRTLRRVEADEAIAPAQLELRRSGEEPSSRPMGQLTTWARRPDGSTIGLAMLRREVAAGEPLELVEGGPILRPIDAPAE